MQGIDPRNLPIQTAEMQAAINLIESGRMPADQRTGVEEDLKRRAEAVKAGLSKVPPGWQSIIQAVDPLLRVRFDVYDKHFIIERFGPEAGCWGKVAAWFKYPNGELLSPDAMAVQLRMADIWAKYGKPGESLETVAERWVEAKRSEARAVKAQNRRASIDKIVEAMDNLSVKQLQNFFEVQHALATGERVTFHGKALDTVEKWAANSRKAQAQGKSKHIFTRKDPVTPGELFRSKPKRRVFADPEVGKE